MTKNKQNDPESQILHIPDYLIEEGRNNKLLPWSWAEQALHNSSNYWISTINHNGRPSLVPIWGIWLNNSFFFSTGRRSKKLSNIEHNSYCVITTEDADQPVIVEGLCEKISDQEQLDNVLKIYSKKYNLPIKASKHGITDEQGKSAPVLIVKPYKVIAWKEFPNTATKWIFN